MTGACGHGHTPPSATGFESIQLGQFQQFLEINLDLSKRLTVITGANGAGKTTILNILGSHFNWYANFLRSPSKQRHEELAKFRSLAAIHTPDTGSRNFIFDATKILEEQAREQQEHYYRSSPPDPIGILTYRGGDRSVIQQHSTDGVVESSVSVDRQHAIEGIHIGSHRTISPYKEVGYIPSKFSSTEAILDAYISELRNALGYKYGPTGNDTSSMLRMKETLLAAAIYGEGNSSVRSDPTAQRVWSGFQKVLSIVLPPSLGFRKLISAPPEVLIDTDSNEFPIDGLSGGLRALFELAWQIHLKSLNSEVFTVCIDEPENHLHPSLQRSLIPDFLTAFPKVNFIIATHSPFVVSASPEAMVYVLRYNDEGYVVSELLDFQDRSLSAERTLTEVLGLETTSPIWVEEKYNKLLEEYLDSAGTEESASHLITKLFAHGLGRLMPRALTQIVNHADEVGESN